MTLHELLQGTTIELELTGLDWQEIDSRLKMLDLILKIETEFSFEYFAKMVKEVEKHNAKSKL